MNIKIKKITSVPEIYRINNLVNSILASDFPFYKAKTIREYQQNVYGLKFFKKFLTEPKHIIFGAYDKNLLVGISAVKMEYGGVAFLEWLAVDKNYRGKGVGSLLIKKTEEWVLKNKGHYYYLITESENNRTEFYPKRGFQLIGVHKKAWFGEDEYIFGKHLRNGVFPEVFKAK